MFNDSVFGTKIAGVALLIDDGSVEGLVFSLPAPNRHHNVIRSLEDRTDIPLSQILSAKQGFVTDTGVFLFRDEAFTFCIENKIELKRPTDPRFYQGQQLFSEDLW